MTEGSPRSPREAQGGPAQTQTPFPRGPGKPSKGAPRDAQKDPGRPREAQGPREETQGKPREAQGGPRRPREAQGAPGPSEAQGDTGRPREAQGNPIVVLV